MRTSTRALRDSIGDMPGLRRVLSPRECDQREAILRAGRTAMAEFGRNSFTLAQFALSIRVAPATIRRYFLDLDCLLMEILGRHLRGLADALGRAEADVVSRRAAYLAHTRKPFGGLTEDHVLFVRDRWTLSAEDQASLAQLHVQLGQGLGGFSAADTLCLLDDSAIDGPEIELLIAHRLARAAAREAELQVQAPAPAPAAVRPRLALHPLPPPALPPLRTDQDRHGTAYQRHRGSGCARAGPS